MFQTHRNFFFFFLERIPIAQSQHIIMAFVIPHGLIQLMSLLVQFCRAHGQPSAHADLGAEYSLRAYGGDCSPLWNVNGKR